MMLPPLVKHLAELKFKKFCDRIVPENLKDRLKLSVKIEGSIITLFEHKISLSNPENWKDTEIAQFKYNFDKNRWSLSLSNQLLSKYINKSNIIINT